MSDHSGRRRRPKPVVPEDPEAAGPPEDPEQVARQILLRRLSDQPRSRAELAASLARRQVPAQVAERLLDRFEEVGLVDDGAFAQAWVDSRHRGRGLARRALAYELRHKGVADDVTHEALGSVDDDSERETARGLVDRKFAPLRRLDRARAERRLVAMLARKGYGQGLAISVVRAAMLDRDDEPAGSGGSDDTSDTSGTLLDLR